MRLGHLDRIELVLHTLAPVFIGSGEKLTKKEYILNGRDGLIYMPHLPKLYSFLSKQNLIAEFEAYLSEGNDLGRFLAEHNITSKDYQNFVAYTIAAGEATKSNIFREVWTFIKGPEGKPYIPGSSLKGVFRTAIAAKLLERGNHNKLIEEISRELENFNNKPKKLLENQQNNLDQRLFCKLEVSDPSRPKWNAIVNDFMRGISISDSEPLECSQLTLCGKYDRKPQDEAKPLPLFRECLAPGTTARFTLTLNPSILAKAGIDREFIKQALRDFSQGYHNNFTQYFKKDKDDADPPIEGGIEIFLGGGLGYVSKTISYPLLKDREQALQTVSRILSIQFKQHNHEKDPGRYRVSPHMLKTTMYKGTYYQMGRCELLFRE